MIKLTRGNKPTQLTTELQDRLTREFKLTGKAVWNLPFLKAALLKMSNDKCCYCEINIQEESKYLEVEHFHHKDLYKDEVMEWDNLLPACKRCNGTKGAHDTKTEPIVDPAKLDPRDHLAYWRYRIKGCDPVGRLTVSVLNLNDQDRLVTTRFQVGDAIQDKLEQLNELWEEYTRSLKTRTRNRVINGLKAIMKEGLPSSVYSGCLSTLIMTDKEYQSLKESLQNAGLWDEELDQLQTELNAIALPLLD